MSKLFSSLFLISLIAYFVFAAVEEFVPGFVSNYFNVHLLLIPVVVFLIAMLAFERSEDTPISVPHKPARFGGKGVGLILFASLITLGTLWVGGHELEIVWRALVALYGGLLVAGILVVLLRD